MATYHVAVEGIISDDFEVEADTPEEAERLAADLMDTKHGPFDSFQFYTDERYPDSFRQD